MVVVQEQKGSLACARCGHPVTVEQVGATVVVQSVLHGWRNVKVFHLEHLVRGLLTPTIPKA